MADIGQVAASASRATWIHQSCSSSKLERSLVGSAPEKEETRSPSLWNVKVGCADTVTVKPHAIWQEHNTACGGSRESCGLARVATHHCAHARLCHAVGDLLAVDVHPVELHLHEATRDKVVHGAAAFDVSEQAPAGVRAQKADAWAGPHVCVLCGELVVDGCDHVAWPGAQARSAHAAQCQHGAKLRAGRRTWRTPLGGVVHNSLPSICAALPGLVRVRWREQGNRLYEVQQADAASAGVRALCARRAQAGAPEAAESASACSLSDARSITRLVASARAHTPRFKRRMMSVAAHEVRKQGRTCAVRASLEEPVCARCRLPQTQAGHSGSERAQHRAALQSCTRALSRVIDK